MNRNRLYAFLLLACITGFAWLVYIAGAGEAECAGGVCLFKGATDIPCPSCGSTRAILALMNGDPLSSLQINPFGIIVLSIIMIAPLWILTDVIRRRSSMYSFYNNVERFLKRPQVMLPFAFLIIINWIWNITKGL